MLIDPYQDGLLIDVSRAPVLFLNVVRPSVLFKSTCYHSTTLLTYHSAAVYLLWRNTGIKTKHLESRKHFACKLFGSEHTEHLTCCEKIVNVYNKFIFLSYFVQDCSFFWLDSLWLHQPTSVLFMCLCWPPVSLMLIYHEKHQLSHHLCNAYYIHLWIFKHSIDVCCSCTQIYLNYYLSCLSNISFGRVCLLGRQSSLYCYLVCGAQNFPICLLFKWNY